MGVISYFLMGSVLASDDADTKPQGARFYVDLAEEDQVVAARSGFAPAEAAIDQAVEQLKAPKEAEERRSAMTDRRTGASEPHPEGAADRRLGSRDRRRPQKSFGKRGG